MRQALLAGLERLTAVTALLHRIRLEEPRGGVWEAADLQWWWRRPRASDVVALPVWFDKEVVVLKRDAATATATATS